jgi:hypothetical protein
MRIAMLSKKSEKQGLAWDNSRLLNQPPTSASNILRKKGFEDSLFNRFAKRTGFSGDSLGLFGLGGWACMLKEFGH